MLKYLNCCILVAVGTVTLVAVTLLLLEVLNSFVWSKDWYLNFISLFSLAYSDIRMLGFKMTSKITLFWN